MTGMLRYFLLVCIGLAVEGEARRWADHPGLLRMRRQQEQNQPRLLRKVASPGGLRQRPGAGEERRGPITQNRRLRPAQPVQLERRRLQEYQPQRDLENFQGYTEPQREQESFQNFRESQRKQDNFQDYREPQREENFQGYRKPQRVYKEAAPVPRPSKVYERNAVVDSDISESGHVPSHQHDLEAAVHAGAAAYNGVGS